MARAVRSLRALLAAIAVVFVGFPLVVYHFFTFDFQRVATTATLSQRFSSRFSPLAQLADVPSYQLRVDDQSERLSPVVALPACLNLPSVDFLSRQGVDAIAANCGAANATVGETNATVGETNATPTQVLVHFAHVPLSQVPRFSSDGGEAPDVHNETFSYLSFAALQSVQRALKPSIMFLHYVTTPRGTWWTQCQRYLSLHNVLPPVAFAPPASAEDAPLPLVTRQQIMQLLLVLRALKKHGGVGFLDFNTFVLRHSLTAQDHPDLFVASQGDEAGFSVGLHMIQAPAGHPLLQHIEDRLLELLAAGDDVLTRLPLEAVVGQLVLERYEQARLSNGSSTFDRVTVATSELSEATDLDKLLTTPVKGADMVEMLGTRAAFSIDPNIYRQQPAAIERLADLQRNQSTAAQWLVLDSVFGAVLRFVVGVNATDELRLA